MPEPEMTEQEKVNGIFKGFHQGSTSIQNLRAAILANNNNSQATQVNTLVSGYGW